MLYPEDGFSIRVIEESVNFWQKTDAGSDMDIAIRGQRERLEQLEDRIQTRREELRR
ncbi:hypothetical protein [Halorubellus sp. PRR65]|uniref:hypothetical protein n=1 Tax=Halorubellus sp. PRR65 TaxID=3098148 RepID=UPI002B260494|nr:hypothetical protein [Halorubellus sp. PRR65]